MSFLPKVAVYATYGAPGVFPTTERAPRLLPVPQFKPRTRPDRPSVADGRAEFMYNALEILAGRGSLTKFRDLVVVGHYILSIEAECLHFSPT